MNRLFRIGIRGSFCREVGKQRKLMEGVEPGLLTEADLASLPELVKQYIRKTGAVGQPKVRSFRVELAGRMRRKSDNLWMPFHSVQHTFLDTTSRLFFMDAVMKHLPVSGYHYYRNGVAYMDIRLLSFFRVQYAAGDQLNRAETVTFFNDMCCLAPAALIDPRITWKESDAGTVYATFTNRGIAVSAYLHFNAYHELVDFISDDRAALTGDGKFLPLRWSTPLSLYDDRLGYHLPRHAEALYEYDDGPFTYGYFEITNVVYNA